MSNIKFWIIFSFLLRLIGITNAPLEGGHNWRQSLTNMISRNFFDHGYDLLYPKIDYAGELTGIIGAEFPFFNLLTCAGFEIFGFDHWYGRLINLFVSCFGIYAFYLLVKRFFNPKIAFNSTIILLVSGWFMFSRKIMPDTFSISLMLIGIWQAVKYFDFGRYIHLFWFFVFSALGILVKLPSIVYFSLFILIPFSKGISITKKVTFIGVSIVSFTIGAIWYFYWVPHLVETYHYQLYFPKSLIKVAQEISKFIHELFERFYKSALQSFIAFGFFLFGGFLLFKERSTKHILLFSSFFLVFCLFILKTGDVFPQHNYYIIPFTPIMSLIAGNAIAKLPQKILIPAICLIAIEAIANQQHDLFIKEKNKYKLEIENFAEEVIPKKSKVIVNGSKNPQMKYLLNRKGWSISNEEILNKQLIQNIISK